MTNKDPSESKRKVTEFSKWFLDKSASVNSRIASTLTSLQDQHSRPMRVFTCFTGWCTAEMCLDGLKDCYNAKLDEDGADDEVRMQANN